MHAPPNRAIVANDLRHHAGEQRPRRSYIKIAYAVAVTSVARLGRYLTRGLDRRHVSAELEPGAGTTIIAIVAIQHGTIPLLRH